MDFVTLYGTELDRELGTADRTQRFTTARRKAAINAAQLEWVKRTECLSKETTLAMMDATGEYDIEATVTDFGAITAQGISIKIVDSGANIRYIEGDDLIETTVERLNVEEPGWRAATPSQPIYWYLRRNGGALYLGVHPAPEITVGDTWTVILPYWIIPADLSADADEPFTVSANILKSLRPYHRYLANFAASQLEQLRKDAEREATQLQKFELGVQDYLTAQAPKRGTRVRMARDYRGDANAHGGRRRFDPRVWP